MEFSIKVFNRGFAGVLNQGVGGSNRVSESVRKCRPWWQSILNLLFDITLDYQSSQFYNIHNSSIIDSLLAIPQTSLGFLCHMLYFECTL